MSWFEKLLPSRIRTSKKKEIPEGLWSKCTSCNSFLFKNELEKNLQVCPKCSYHMRLSARKRIQLFLDEENQVEIAEDISPRDVLKFKDTKKYKDRLSSAQKNTGEKDALIAFSGTINQLPVVVCVFEFNFIGGSMGTVVGEKFVRAIYHCINNKLPLICFSSSGGARMQESLLSLMQMAKTSAALAKLSKAKLPYISVMLDPCMGGVSASLSMLGDINIVEPFALIGFAGPKVIQQTLREELPEGFQRSEFLLEKGVVDMIVDRRDMKQSIHRLLVKLSSNA